MWKTDDISKILNEAKAVLEREEKARDTMYSALKASAVKMVRDSDVLAAAVLKVLSEEPSEEDMVKLEAARVLYTQSRDEHIAVYAGMIFGTLSEIATFLRAIRNAFFNAAGAGLGTKKPESSAN